MSTQFSNGWAQVELGELIDKSADKADPTEIDPVPYVGLEHIEQGTGKLSYHGQSSEVKSTKAKFSEGDLLYGKLRPYLNKVWIASFDGVCSTDILVFPPAEKVSQKYLYYRLMSSDFVQYANAKSSGVNHPRVSYKKVSQFEIGLPSLPEQRRIVAKIEELFSDLEAGVADLKRAQQQLQRYRQSVLQAAVEGRLTKDWRNQHDTEPADKLLERILEERQAQWAKDYRAKYEAKGKEPPSGWKSRYKPAEEPDVSDLPELPKGWTWANVQQLSIVYGGVTKNARKGGDLATLPYLRVANVYADELRLDEIKQISVKKQRVYKYLLEEGDLLVVEGNGSKSQIGRVAQWDGSIEPCVHQNHLIKVRPCIREVGDYLLHWMLSSNGRSHITKVASSTSGLYTLSLTKVRSIPVPLPPLEEQPQIVNEVERLLSVADGATQTVEREIKRAERLRQSILKQAFSGQLLGQSGSADSTEESVPVAANKEGMQIEMSL